MNIEKNLLGIPGLVRCETTPRERALAQAAEMTHAVYPHDQLFGQIVTVQEYIDCPPADVYEYLTDVRSLDEFTFSTRHFRPSDEPGLFVGWDTLADDTKIYMKIVADQRALTIDYHCAWDQGRELWMIYFFRILPAELALKRSGSVVVWSNCHHPYYDRNPHPELASSPKRPWVGDFWNLFYAGHSLELSNLKSILEYRHQRGLPVRPFAARAAE